MFDKLSSYIYNETLLSLMFDKLSISIYNESLTVKFLSIYNNV